MTDIRLQARPTLVGALWPEQASNGQRAARAALLALLGTAVMTLSARMSVPFWPVPMTMESFAVLVIGAAYGLRLGAATLVLYLLEGAAGLPVFAGTPMQGTGLAYVLGPTGGYLLGFVAAAALVGFFAERGADRSTSQLLGAIALGHIVLFAFGYAWLAHLMGVEVAWRAGVEPFILGTLVKTFLAALLVPAVWGVVSRHR